MRSRVKTPVGEDVLVALLPPLLLAETGIWKLMRGYETRRYAGSDLLLSQLMGEGRLISLTPEEIEDLFDRMEFLITLEYAAVRMATPDVHFWTPPGLYLWRRDSRQRQRRWAQDAFSHLVKAGLLGGTDTKAVATLAAVDEHLKKIPNY
jgi:hypothetical protein